MAEVLNVSIVTACLNSAETLEATLLSIYGQSYRDFQHVIVDGGSSDRSMDIISSHKWKNRIVISEKDNGIYSAFNKGLMLSTGNIIGFLNADDQFVSNHSLQEVVDEFKQTGCNATYADLQYVSRGCHDKVIRNWVAGHYCRSKLKFGWMPPHPTFYCSKEILLSVGGFDATLDISADYKLMLNILQSDECRVKYIPKPMVKMQYGGASNSRLLTKVREDYKVIADSNLFGLTTLIFKNLRKLHQFI